MGVTEAIEQAVAELEPGGQLLSARVLEGGVSADVFGLVIATVAGERRRVVLRRHSPDGHKRHGQTIVAKEFRLLAVLHQLGFAVPEPHLYDDTTAADPFLVMDWVDGSTSLAADDVPGALDQMARFLSDLHTLDPLSLQLDLDPIEDPAVAVVPYLPSTDIGRALAATISSLATQRRVGRRAVLHGDYWPGNVLWDGGRLVAVIDWEDASVGDPLADLATARVELLCQYGDEAMDRFTTRYLDIHRDTIGQPLELDALALWELYVSASALALMGDWGLEPSEEARRRTRTQAFFDRAARAVRSLSLT